MKRLYIALNVLALLICACGINTSIAPPQIEANTGTQVPETASFQQPLKVIGIVKTPLTIRNLPTEKSAILGYLKPGNSIILLGNLDRGTPDCKAGWYLIDGGYVCAEYLTLVRYVRQLTLSKCSWAASPERKSHGTTWFFIRKM